MITVLSLDIYSYLCTGRVRVGFKAKRRRRLDTARFFTYVFRRSFKRRGTIRSVLVFVGHRRRPLSLAVFRRIGKGRCYFKVVQRVNLRRKWKLGYNRVRHKLLKEMVTSCKVIVMALL